MKKKQLDKAINRAFWTCRGTFGKTWGPKPKVVYWIYTVAKTGSEQPLIGPEPACSISIGVAKKPIMDWTGLH
jgi:hypothetical protein